MANVTIPLEEYKELKELEENFDKIENELRTEYKKIKEKIYEEVAKKKKDLELEVKKEIAGRLKYLENLLKITNQKTMSKPKNTKRIALEILDEDNFAREFTSYDIDYEVANMIFSKYRELIKDITDIKIIDTNSKS